MAASTCKPSAHVTEFTILKHIWYLSSSQIGLKVRPCLKVSQEGLVLLSVAGSRWQLLSFLLRVPCRVGQVIKRLFAYELRSYLDAALV